MRTRDHARIKAIADEYFADHNLIEISKPGKLDDCTTFVARKMAKDHKYYKALVESKPPAKHPLYKSLLKHLHKVYIDSEDPPHDSSKDSNDVPDSKNGDSNDDEEEQDQ